MSFIITVYTNEGIIMASDSRITYTTTETLSDGTKQKNFGIQITDTTYKTFLCTSRIGISTCGVSSINQKPIAGFIEDFISQKTDENSTVETISQGLIDYFCQFNPVPKTKFIVAGYNSADTVPKVSKVSIATQTITNTDTSNSGATWDGETEVLIKLIKPVALKDSNGTYQDLSCHSIGFNYFTLQDAINFAKYAVDTTIKTMSFQDCVKTVGGPIDILAIKPNKAVWIQRKELHP